MYRQNKSYLYDNADEAGRKKVIDAMSMYYNDFNYEEAGLKDHWDISVTGNTKEMLWECKDRNFKSTAYTDEGWMLNCNKCRWLKEESRKQNKKAYYVNTFQDNKIVIWNVTDLPDDYPITYKQAWAHTVERDKKIMKDYYMLYVKDAELIIDIDELSYYKNKEYEENMNLLNELYGFQ